MSWVMVFITNAQSGIFEVSKKSWIFLILSGLATGASWLCYYKALQIGEVSKVVPIDKLSVVITLILAFVFLSIFIFIICGYEHVIANACYFTYAKFFSWKALFYFFLMMTGNSIGAIFTQGIRKNIQSLYAE